MLQKKRKSVEHSQRRIAKSYNNIFKASQKKKKISDCGNDGNQKNKITLSEK
jgi:hypothetical protein